MNFNNGGRNARSLSGLIVGHDTSLASSRYIRLGEPCKSTRAIGEPCNPVFKEAQPRPSKKKQATKQAGKHTEADTRTDTSTEGTVLGY